MPPYYNQCNKVFIIIFKTRGGVFMTTAIAILTFIGKVIPLVTDLLKSLS